MTHILAMGGTLHGQLRCIQSLYSSQPTLVNLPTTTYLTSPKKEPGTEVRRNSEPGRYMNYREGEHYNSGSFK